MAMLPERFPVLITHHERDVLTFLNCPVSVPWAFVAPHSRRAFLNHNQSLERLAQRGGLGPDESVAVIEDRQWSRMTMSTAVLALNQILQRWQAYHG